MPFYLEYSKKVPTFAITIFASMSEEEKYTDQGSNIVSEPVAAYSTRRRSTGITHVHDELDDLDWDHIPILGPKSIEEAVTRLERSEANLNNPTHWTTSEQMWEEMHQKFPWL